MNRTIIPIAFIAISFLTLNAKRISGVIVDDDSNPIEFANITAFKNDSVAGGGISDASGIFCIEVDNECNRLRISIIGYDDVTISPAETDLGKITLKKTSTTLKEVVVKAPLVRRTTDRIVLNVAENPLSANKDAHELLKTAPGVWATDDDLSIYGQSGTTVYVNDIKVNLSGTQLTTYLKSIQSSSISSIEIIPKTGAEYSADSAGGVIKIILKRNRIDGLNGAAGTNATAGEYKQWFNPFANVSLHSGKWTVNVNGNINASPFDKYVTNEESTNAALSQEIKGVNYQNNKSLQGNLMLGLFFDPSVNDKIGLQIDYNTDRSKHFYNSKTIASGQGIEETTDGKYTGKDCFHNLNIALNWSRSIDDKGSVLKLISNYNRQYSSVNENNEMSGTMFQYDSVYKTDNINRYDILTTDLSLNKTFNPQWTMNLGAKYTYNNVAYKSSHRFLYEDVWKEDSIFDYDSSYVENIAAIYAILNGQAGKLRFKMGIRGEYFGTRGILTKDDRFDLFPNANVSYDLNEKGDYTVALSYARNIRRPSFWSLNPVTRQVANYYYTVGNPELTPSFTNSVSLNFLLAGKFTIATGYSMSDNPIRQMLTSNSDHPERMYLTWGNEGKARNMFIHGDGFIKITNQWNLYSNITYIVTSQKFSDSEQFDTFGYLQIIANTTYLLPNDFNLSISCFYNSKMKIGNISVYPRLNLNPTIQKRFGKNWAISLGFENILQRKTKLRTSSNGYDRYTSTKSHVAAKLGVTYNFNSGKKFKQKKIEQNTDKSRLSKE